MTTKVFFCYFLSPMIILLNAPGVLPAPSIHSLPALHIPKLSRPPSTNPFSSNPKNLSYIPPTSRPRPGIQEPPFPPDGNRTGPPNSRVCSHVSQLGQNRLQVLARKARSQLGASLTPHAVGEVGGLCRGGHNGGTTVCRHSCFELSASFLHTLESRRRTGHWIPRPSKGEIWARFGGVVLA